MRKIMFSDKFGLTKAVLEGRKTMTRRVIPIDETRGGLCPVSFWNGKWCGSHGRPLKRQPYKVGEVVAVAQAYKDVFLPGVDEFLESSAAWKNKMFVCPEDMPHQICITDVRVELLQDITEDDILREGVEKDGDVYSFNDYEGFNTAQLAFKALINRVSGRGSWELNPFVFVYSFELVK